MLMEGERRKKKVDFQKLSWNFHRTIFGSFESYNDQPDQVFDIILLNLIRIIANRIKVLVSEFGSK